MQTYVLPIQQNLCLGNLPPLNALLLLIDNLSRHHLFSLRLSIVTSIDQKSSIATIINDLCGFSRLSLGLTGLAFLFLQMLQLLSTCIVHLALITQYLWPITFQISCVLASSFSRWQLVIFNFINFYLSLTIMGFLHNNTSSGEFSVLPLMHIKPSGTQAADLYSMLFFETAFLLNNIATFSGKDRICFSSTTN